MIIITSYSDSQYENERGKRREHGGENNGDDGCKLGVIRSVLTQL